MKTRPSQHGFTLAELLVVAGVIGLVLALLVPMVRGLFSAGADVQAAGQMTAMLGAARGQAIDLQRPSALMCGVGADHNGWAGNVPVSARGWAVVMRHYYTYSNVPYFIPSTDTPPQALPGTMACGGIANGSPYISGSAFNNGTLGTDAALEDFTRFAVVFNSDGTLVDQVDSGYPVMANYIAVRSGAVVYEDPKDVNYSHIVFRTTDYGADTAKIDKIAVLPIPSSTSRAPTIKYDTSTLQPGSPVDAVAGRIGMRSFTIFDYRVAKVATATRGDYLNKNGNFFCVNPYTGQVIPAD